MCTYSKDGAAFFKSEGATVILGLSNKKVRGPRPPAPGSDAYALNYMLL